MTQALDAISVVDVPALVEPERFPTTADREAGEYNRQSKLWADRQPLVADNQYEIAVANRTNALAGKAAAEAAVPAGAAAVAARDEAVPAAAAALAARDETLPAAAQAVDAAARAEHAAATIQDGPVTSVVTPTGVHTGAVELGIADLVDEGDIIAYGATQADARAKIAAATALPVGSVAIGFAKPADGVWLDPDAVYLKASYSALAAMLVKVYDGTFNPVASTMAASLVWLFTAYGNGKFVATAVSGTVAALSTNAGLSWVNRAIPSNQGGRGVAFGKDKFIAIGNSGTGAITSDGENWVAGTLPNGNWGAIAHGGDDRWIALGYDSTTVAISTDGGATWITRSMPVAAFWEGCVFGNGKWVAVGWTGSGSYIATSVDGGLTWTLRSVPAGAPTRLCRVVFGNGIFVVIPSQGTTAAGVVSSTDGETWIYTAVANVTYAGIAYGNGVFFISTGGHNVNNDAFLSRDGRDWIAVKMNTSLGWRGVAFGDDTFVVVAGAAASTPTTAASRVKVFSYDPATQFYLPRPYNAFGSAKQWVKAE